MSGFFDGVGNVLSNLGSQIKSMGIIDYIDIIIVAFLLYQLYKFIRDRRAGKLAAGVLLLGLVFIISEFVQMHALRFLLSNIFQVGIVSIIVLFQPELRSALEKVGGEPLKSLRNIGEQKSNAEVSAAITGICDAVCDMSKTKTGALIVIERTTKLGDIVKTGTVVNANISSLLIKNIFFKNSPLHDGAAIITGTRLHAAGCYLPLTTSADVDPSLGTRHRAAIGMSENSDAVIISVSEETGTISIALNGKLMRNFDYRSLYNQLTSLLITPKKAYQGPKTIMGMKKKSD